MATNNAKTPPKKRKQKFEGTVVDANMAGVTGSGFFRDDPMEYGETMVLAVRVRVADIHHKMVNKVGFVRNHTLKVVRIANLEDEVADLLTTILNNQEDAAKASTSTNKVDPHQKQLPPTGEIIDVKETK